jgi:hypothetical protein
MRSLYHGSSWRSVKKRGDVPRLPPELRSGAFDPDVIILERT